MAFSSLRVIDKISCILIEGFDDIDYELARLSNVETRNYYEIHINNMHTKPLSQIIKLTYKYFLERLKSKNPYFYFGRSYGEETKPSAKYINANNKVYVDLRKKKKDDLVNLSIIKIELENKFISYKLNKFITFLSDFNLINLDEYNKYIYGTSDTFKIKLTKLGLSISLISRLEKDGQLKNLYLDENNNLQAKKSFEKFKSSIDDFYRFEIERFL